MTKNLVNSQAEDHYVFLDYLRAAASLIVVYAHLIAGRAGEDYSQTIVSESIFRFLIQPFGIVQDFGFFGVAIFFLISGFVIAHVSLKETPSEFLLKRFFRIFPPLAIAIVVAIVLNVDNVVESNPLTLESFFLNISLLNYWNIPQTIYLGVAWSLVVEVVFYLIVFFIMMSRLSVTVSTLFFTFFSFVVTYFRADFGNEFFLFYATSSYIPYLAFGYILYHFLESKKLKLMPFVFHMITIFLVMVFAWEGVSSNPILGEDKYIVNYLLALVLFLVLYHFRRRVKATIFSRYMSKMSYSLYLFHGTLGFYLYDVLLPYLGWVIGLFLTLFLLLVWCFMFYAFVEKPFMRLPKKIEVYR